MLDFCCTDNKYFVDVALGFLEKILIVTADFDRETNLRPNLSGVLFRGGTTSKKSGCFDLSGIPGNLKHACNDFSVSSANLRHSCDKLSENLAAAPRFCAKNKLHRDALLLFLAYRKLKKTLPNW